MTTPIPKHNDSLTSSSSSITGFNGEDSSTIFTREEVALVAATLGKKSVLSSSSSATFGKQETRVSRNNRALVNRLLSIRLDWEYVARVAEANPSFSMFANLRNGAWYFPPAVDEARMETCRFKSVDGHSQSWYFHARRGCNFEVLRSVAKSGGALLIDSSQHGKTFPDSFNRTVPLWAALMNAAIFSPPHDDNADDDSELRTQTPPWVMDQECANPMSFGKKELKEWTREVRELISRDEETARAAEALRRAGRRLQTVFACNDEGSWTGVFKPETYSFESLGEFCVPLVLVSCSATQLDDARHRERYSFSYVRGAGDDEENWRGDARLTPQVFRRHHEAILEALMSAEEEDDDDERLKRALDVVLGNDERNIEVHDLVFDRSVPPIRVTIIQGGDSVMQLGSKLWFRKHRASLETRTREALRFASEHLTQSQGKTELVISVGDVQSGMYLLGCVLLHSFAFDETRRAWTVRGGKSQTSEEGGFFFPREDVKTRVKFVLGEISRRFGAEGQLDRQLMKEMNVYFTSQHVQL